jgi:low temperature requirement protein LtrA
LAERRSPTPWHAHHIAERYGLLLLITLGEGVLGTVTAVNALVHGEHGWTSEAALLAVAGIGLTFGLWWMYFAVPWGDVLAHHRDRVWPWAFGHFLLLGAVAATGAGLHVATYFLEGSATLGPTQTVLTVAVPVAVYIVTLYAVYWAFLRQGDFLHVLLLAGTAAVILLAVVCAELGAGTASCLVVVMLAPAVTVAGFELVGHRRLTNTLLEH